MNRLLRRAGAVLALLAAGLAVAGPRELAVPGGVAFVRLGEADPALADLVPPPRAWFGERPLLVTRRGNAWFALVGLPLHITPGQHAIRLRPAAPGASGTTLRFAVADKRYPEQRLVIKDARKVTPGAADMVRIEREQELIGRIKLHWRDASAVDLDFRLPAGGPLSSRFGLRRVFNGQARNPHAGLDLAVAADTPVVAAAAGVVANTGDYFFNGRTVFVDHGQGLITMYCHLQDIDVRAGQPVASGQALGRSGMSGRATGPHLHWSVILNGNMVDPELFIAAPGP
ncbi:MAG: peptidoglycan DD-metalloendopeptidase family protein [Betaproteobacteria bacterium]|nr:peptidoglycan DD-metalloendopeptidase family protein [Betaproteobacteria bacterium]